MPFVFIMFVNIYSNCYVLKLLHFCLIPNICVMYYFSVGCPVDGKSTKTRKARPTKHPFTFPDRLVFLFVDETEYFMEASTSFHIKRWMGVGALPPFLPSPTLSLSVFR